MNTDSEPTYMCIHQIALFKCLTQNSNNEIDNIEAL